MLKSPFSLSVIFGPAQESSEAGEVLRLASPNERRCIIREDVGFYNALIVGGIYEFQESGIDSTSVHAYAAAIRKCIQKHPQLNIIIEQADTESPVYVRVPKLDIRNHIQILDDKTSDSAQKELELIEAKLPLILDAKWTTGIPPWKIVVLPLVEQDQMGSTRSSRCFIAFSYSHGIGDGVSGLAFHRTLLSALQTESLVDKDKSLWEISSSTRPFPASFESPQNLPISWSFLLGPALGAYLPNFLSSALGLRAAATSPTPGTYTGPSIFYEPATYRTGTRLLEIDATTLSKAITNCRQHNAKLTALIHQFIIRALRKCLPENNNVDNYISQTALNLRGAVGVSDNQMGLFVSGYYDVHPSSTASDNINWEVASSMSTGLAKSSKALQDQPVGLLRYLLSIRSWTLGHIGQPRDGSYEISNLMAFDPSGEAGRYSKTCKIEKMIFTQPGNVTSSPICFNVVSVKGGSLVCALGWQIGALGMSEGEERKFVEDVSESIRRDFEALV